MVGIDRPSSRKAESVNRLRKVLVFLRPFKRPLLIAVALTGCLTLIGMLPPLLMRRLLNDVAREGKWGLFPLVMGLLFAVPVVSSLVNIANAATLNFISLGIITQQ